MAPGSLQQLAAHRDLPDLAEALGKSILASVGKSHSDDVLKLGLCHMRACPRSLVKSAAYHHIFCCVLSSRAKESP